MRLHMIIDRLSFLACRVALVKNLQYNLNPRHIAYVARILAAVCGAVLISVMSF